MTFRMTPPSDMYDAPSAERRVVAPANGLIAVASLSIALNCLCALGLPMLSSPREVKRPEGMDEEEFKYYQLGRQSSPLFTACALSIPTLIVYPIAIIGAIRMKQLRSHWLAVLSCFLVLLPCSLLFVAGIPVGIWALVVLCSATVRSEFQ